MNIILLSGGSGKRLWPLSNDIMSKQFIKIFKNGDRNESMLQRIYGQIRAVDPEADVTVATPKFQISTIHSQLGTDVGISVEPCRRDTFAAISLASAYLHEVKHVDRDEAVVICPVDPYVEEEYFRCVRKMYDAAKTGDKNLVLMGIEPTYPSEKYGYIRPVRENGAETWKFTEKPSKAEAERYIAEGALWNGGVFAYKLGYVLDKARKMLGTDDYNELLSGYADLKKISFDYAVAERETEFEIVKYSGTWKDLGTWNTLTEAMDTQAIGDARFDDTSRNVHVINELGVPVLVMGIEDAVVAATPDGILVADKEQSSYIKPYAEAIKHRIMFAEKSWGSFRVLDVAKESMTLKVTLNPGHRMNYHSHDHRVEVWNVIAGSGKAIVDGVTREIFPGDAVNLPVGCRHTVMAGEKGLQLIEIQMGKDIDVEDKIKYEFNE